jgi:hypothetical protein
MATEAHDGGCHCGAVRYTATLDLAEPVIACNCSICAAKGLLLSFVTADKLQIQRGEGELATYRFNTMNIGHRFCRICGVEVFGQVEGQGAAVNVRTLDDVDMAALKQQPFDGASRNHHE